MLNRIHGAFPLLRYLKTNTTIAGIGGITVGYIIMGMVIITAK